MIPTPKSLDEIPPIVNWDVKPNWHGVRWHLLGWFMEFFYWLGASWAKRFMEDYTHQMFGWTMLALGKAGPLGKRLAMHEGMHIWQEANIPFHRLKVALDPRGIQWLPISRRYVSYRGHSEAAAYATDVINGRKLDSAARALANPAYASGLSVEEAADLILRYKQRLRTE